jgi:hypothetical protein
MCCWALHHFFCHPCLAQKCQSNLTLKTINILFECLTYVQNSLMGFSNYHFLLFKCSICHPFSWMLNDSCSNILINDLNIPIFWIKCCNKIYVQILQLLNHVLTTSLEFCECQVNNLALSREVEGIASNLSMLELFKQLNNSLWIQIMINFPKLMMLHL